MAGEGGRFNGFLGSWAPSVSEGCIYRPASDRVIIQTTILARESREGTKRKKMLLSFFSSGNDNGLLATIVKLRGPG